MGQARLRGTKDQRVDAAVKIVEARKLAADHAEMAKLREEARKWAEMTPEQQNSALERAKAEARNYGQLMDIFGPDVAAALARVM